jgi:hypothetical protein
MGRQVRLIWAPSCGHRRRGLRVGSRHHQAAPPVLHEEDGRYRPRPHGAPSPDIMSPWIAGMRSALASATRSPLLFQADAMDARRTTPREGTFRYRSEYPLRFRSTADALGVSPRSISAGRPDRACHAYSKGRPRSRARPSGRQTTGVQQLREVERPTCCRTHDVEARQPVCALLTPGSCARPRRS